MQGVIYSKTGYVPFLYKSEGNFSFPFSGILEYLSKLDANRMLTQILHFNPDAYYDVSSLLVVAFLLAQLYLFARDRSKRLTLYSLVLAFQILSVSMLSQFLLSCNIDSTGRYAMGLFLFSVLYYAESRRKYPLPLALFAAMMSSYYFVAKIILWSASYYVT